MREVVQSILIDQCGLDPSRQLLVGISGGPDSLCLLHVLHSLGWQLSVAHLDHALRPDSAAEAVWVEQLTVEWNYPCVLERADTRQFAFENSLSIEEAARILRYRFLFTQAARLDLQAVLVAHTADDQVETILMHLLRGAGLPGLRGMPVRSLPNPWSNTLPLVRPLLGVWREQIDQYLQEHELVALQDPSNQDRTYFRNRLRHELIPYLQSYQPEIKPIMLRTADVFAQEDAFLDEAAAAAWQAALCDQGAGYLGFKRDVLTSQPLALQRRILRRAVYQLRPGLRDLDFVTVDKAVQFLENPPKGRQANLLAGLRFVWEDARLWLAGWETELPAFDQDGVPWPQLPGNAAVTLSLPGSFDLGNGWQLMGYLPDASRTHQAVTSNSDPYQAWLDYDRLSEAGFPLTLRPRLPGDRLQPLGMQGHSIKLSEFMINCKLASRARRLWPLVLAGRKIAWVPGLRLAHPFRVTEDTRQVVHLVLARQSES